MFKTKTLVRLVSAVLATGVFVAAHAAESESDSQQSAQQDSKVDRIQVTGSRIKRNTVEGPSPVTVLTNEQIVKEGFVTAYDALNSLTQTTGSIQNELFQNGFTPNANVLNLRGLGPGRVLTLINGRRAADYPLPYNGQSNFVNLGSIPAAAIDRIEILSGGASAIYGSDAVAGVVNIILRSKFEGDQVTVKAGKPTEGGDNTYDLQFVGGKTGDDWSITYAFEYFQRGAIFASERDFMDSYDDNPDEGARSPITGLYIWNRNTNSYLDINADETCARFNDYVSYDFTPINGRGEACGYWGYPATQQIRNQDENGSAYVYGTYELSDTTEAFFSINYWQSEATTASSTQFWQPTFRDANNGNSIITLLRIFTPQETGGLDGLQSIYEESSYDVSTGVKGLMGDYDWEVTVSHSAYDTSSRRPRFLNQNLADYFLGPRLGVSGGYNVYAPDYTNFLNPLDEATYRSLNTIVTTDAESSVTQASFVVSGDLFELPAGAMKFAAVAEFGTQEYDLKADPRILPGQTAIYNLTGTGGGGDRDRTAVGLELSIPLLESLTLSAAGRFDKYDDITAVDDAFTYNFGLEWRPTESLLIRGAYATSFRAPDMHFVFAEQSGFFSTIFDEFKCRNAGLATTQCGGNNATYNYSAFGIREGNKELEEEEGVSITYGLVWDITDDFSFQLDYYKIELEGVVGDISASYVLQNEADCRLGQTRQGTPVDGSSAACQFWLNSVVRYPVGDVRAGDVQQVIRGPINRSFLSNEGLDASATYKMATESFGEFTFAAAWSHVLDQKFSEFASDPRESYRDDPTNFDFRSRVRGSISWEMGDFTTTVFGTRFGSLPNWAETGRIAPHMVYNTTIRYNWSSELAFTLNVNNVLNNFHPEDDTYNTYPYFWRAYSPIGREVFVQVDYAF